MILESLNRTKVFCQFRQAVEEIVAFLNTIGSHIRATIFVGQAASKDGTKGMTQKDQQKVCA